MKNIKFALLAATVLAGAASTASAADLGRYEGGSLKDSYVAPFSWTGLYIGLHGGYTWGDTEATDSGKAWPGGYNKVGDRFTAAADGVVVGGTLGYNRQIGALVLGVEGDLGWLNASGKQASSYEGYTFVESDGGLYVSARGRVGLAVDRTLLYVTGGYFGADLGSKVYDRTSAPGAALLDTNSTGFQSGWTIGGGVEQALGSGWSLKAEYLYYDLGSSQVTGTEKVTSLPIAFDIDNSGSIVRAGLNYKFGGSSDSLK